MQQILIHSEEDSDLLSLQKEFEDDFDSPFLKRGGAGEAGGARATVAEIPAEVPFISSLAGGQTGPAVARQLDQVSYVLYI